MSRSSAAASHGLFCVVTCARSVNYLFGVATYARNIHFTRGLLPLLIAGHVSCATFDCATLANSTSCSLVRYLVHTGTRRDRCSDSPWYFHTPRALVVGNNVTESFQQLYCCANDAQDVSDLLHRKGYAVDLLVNASSTDMSQALKDLKNSMTPARFVVVYFSGHGQYEGQDNVMIATDGMYYLGYLGR